MDSSGYVRAGEPFRPSASAWNRLIALEKSATADAQVLQTRTKKRPSHVLIKSVAAKERFSPVQLGTALIEPDDSIFQGMPVFQAIAPEEDKPFAIATEPIRANGMGNAVAAGITLAHVAIADEDHYCVRINAQGKLESSFYGHATIIWKDEIDLNDNAWCLIDIGTANLINVSEAQERNWQEDMPGIVFVHPGGIRSGLFANLEEGDDAGPRMDMGWGGAGGGNFELYSKHHETRGGQFRVIYGGSQHAQILFTHYGLNEQEQEQWHTVGGVTKEGRFFVGAWEETPPGETEEYPAPEHPFQVYDEGTTIVFAVQKDGAIKVVREDGASTPADADLPKLSFALYQNNDKVMCKIKDEDGAVTTFALGEGGGALPDGTATGQIVHWNNSSKTWVVSQVGTLSTGDLLQWDGNKFINIKPSDLIQYSIANKRLEVFEGGQWKEMPNGSARSFPG